MSNGLIQFKKSSPYKAIFIIVLYAIGSTSLPYIPEILFNFSEKINMLLYIILKAVTIIYGIYLVCSFGYKHIFKYDLKSFFIAMLLYIPCILVCINNFPIVALITKNASLNIKPIEFCLYILICLSIAIFEEVIFRGLIFPIFLEKFSSFKAIMLSSLVFSLCHLINAFSINIGYVVLQVGYSFLIGAMCAVNFEKSNSIYLPIILHFIFNFGGLLLDYNLVQGNIWDKWSVIVTAVLGVFTFAYTIIVYFKDKKNESSNTKGEKCNP